MTTEGHATAIWTDGPQAQVVRQIIERLGVLRVIGVGGPRVAEVDDLARHFQAPREDDLRKLLVERRSPFVLLASMTDVAPEDLVAALHAGATVLTLEPAAASFDDLNPAKPAGRAEKSGVGRLLLSPAFERSRGWTSAAQPQQVLGRPQFISFTSLGGPHEGSLFSRLADAWSMLLQLAPLPDAVDAAASGPLNAVAGDLRSLTGHIVVQARWASNLAASIQASDRAGTAGRRLHVIGSDGHLVVGDGDYTLHDGAGKLLDNLDPQPAALSYVDLVAADWSQLIKGAAPAVPPEQARLHDERVLACCLACLLSARTMQPESPEKLMKLKAS